MSLRDRGLRPAANDFSTFEVTQSSGAVAEPLGPYAGPVEERKEEIAQGVSGG
jgi:hypothetical protein